MYPLWTKLITGRFISEKVVVSPLINEESGKINYEFNMTEPLSSFFFFFSVFCI